MARDLIEYLEYIAPDGAVYRFESDDKFVLSETGFGMPPIEYHTSRSPSQHGESVLDYRLQPRIIQIVHRRNGCSREELYQNRAQLLNMLRPNRNGLTSYNLGVLRKYLPDGSRRDLYVTISEGPEFVARNPDVWDEWSITETIRLIAHDPLFFDPDQKSVSLTLASEGFTFPFSMPLLIDDDMIDTTLTCTTEGTEDTFPDITLTGPISGVKITNESLDLQISLSYNISNGETVTIYLQPGNKRVISDVSGDITGAAYYSSDLATFRLAPHPKVTNGDNTIRFHGSGIVPGGTDTAIAMTWYDRYIGF